MIPFTQNTLDLMMQLSSKKKKQAGNGTDGSANQIYNVLDNNKSKNFVKRILKPKDYPTLDIGNNNYATHKMAWGQEDNDYDVYPTVIQDGKKLKQLGNKSAFDYAKKNNEYIKFDTPEKADKFSKNYKKVWGKDGEAAGGNGEDNPERAAGGEATIDMRKLISPLTPPPEKRDNSIRNLVGQIFSNVKRPASYNDDSVSPEQIFEGGLNTMTGKDEPAWKKEKGGLSEEEWAARDYLNRASFMPDKEANRFGGADTFLRTGNNNMILNPKNKFGSQIQSILDKNANLLSEDDIKHTMYQGSNEETNTPYEWKDLTGVDQAGINRDEYRKELKIAPVMANIEFNRTGEGEDSKGYYNMYKGSDAWDFALHPDEKILNKKQSGGLDYKKSLVNMVRSLVDPMMDKQTVNYESKVYPEFEGDATLSNEKQTSPGKYKLKHALPRKLKVSPGLYMNADDN